MSNDITLHTEEELSKEQVIDHVLAHVSAGRSVSAVLREDPGMPPAWQFWKWHYSDDDLQEKVARAREHGVEAVLEDARMIADNPIDTHERMQEVGPDGVKRRVTTKEALGHRRLQIDTRIKYAQMIAPRKYGVKVDLTSDGEKISSIADAVAAGNARLKQEKDNG